MRPRKKALSKKQMFEKLEVGKAMSQQVGSDSYGYWISEVNEKENYVGLYKPETKYTRCWQDGNMTSEDFNPNINPDFYITAYRGKWYKLDNKTLVRRYNSPERFYLSDKPINYRDPSF